MERPVVVVFVFLVMYSVIPFPLSSFPFRCPHAALLPFVSRSLVSFLVSRLPSFRFPLRLVPCVASRLVSLHPLSPLTRFPSTGSVRVHHPPPNLRPSTFKTFKPSIPDVQCSAWNTGIDVSYYTRGTLTKCVRTPSSVSPLLPLSLSSRSRSPLTPSLRTRSICALLPSRTPDPLPRPVRLFGFVCFAPPAFPALDSTDNECT